MPPPPPPLEPYFPLALYSVDCTKQFCTLETRQNDIFFQSMDFLWHGRRIRIVQDRAKYCFLAYLYKYVHFFSYVSLQKKNVFIFSLKYTFLFHDRTSEQKLSYFINTTKRCSYYYIQRFWYVFWKKLSSKLFCKFLLNTQISTIFCNIFLFEAKVFKKMPLDKILHNWNRGLVNSLEIYPSTTHSDILLFIRYPVFHHVGQKSFQRSSQQTLQEILT